MIYQALKQIDPLKAEYFKWKHDLYYHQDKEKKTPEQFLKTVNRKTFDSFVAWERTEEYKALLMLYLNTKVADDFQDIYEIVSEKSKEGDSQAIKVFLQLQKEIRNNAKIASNLFEQVEDDEEENEDDLDLDLS